MKLYHFTDIWCLKSEGTILKEGIKPAVEKQGLDLQPHGVVWLTSQPECKFASREPEVCIQLFIPSNDKQLVKWQTWLRQHNEHEILAKVEHEDSIGWRSWFCYFGIVPPNMIRKLFLTQTGRRIVKESQRDLEVSGAAR